MDFDKTTFFKGLVETGLKERYGTRPGKWVRLRHLWEIKQIIDGGFIDHYLQTFWVYKVRAELSGIAFWARGAMPSSIVCYALRLTEVDPLRFGLHSARFLNDEPPKFQFDIEQTKAEEFRILAEETLSAEGDMPNVESVRCSILGDVTPMTYLSKPQQRAIPEGLDDEVIRYALSSPDTMPLLDAYEKRKSGKAQYEISKPFEEVLLPTYGLLVYQEQMLDVMQTAFKVPSLEANRIRRDIQRGDAAQTATDKEFLFAHKQLDSHMAEQAWDLLTSNPRAAMKAHAVSRVLARYYYETEY